MNIRCGFPAGLVLIWVAGLSGCGGGTPVTKPADVVVPPTTAATPSITSADPSRLVAGGGDFELVVHGSGFLPTSVVFWNGLPRPAGSTAPTSDVLSAKIGASDIAHAGQATVKVENPVASNVSVFSNDLIVDIVNAVQIASVSPSYVMRGSSDAVLTITGRGMDPGTVANWNGTPKPTVYVNDATITVTVPAADLAAANIAELIVVNGAHQESNLVAFPIEDGVVRTVERISTGNENTDGSFGAGINQDGSVIGYINEGNFDFEIVQRKICAASDSACVASTNAVSVTTNGSSLELTNQPSAPVMSADGRFVAFALDPLSLNSNAALWVRDTCLAASNCTPSTENPDADLSVPGPKKALPAISGDGRYVSFTAGDSDGYLFDTAQAYVIDSCVGTQAGCSPSVQLTSQDETGATIPYTLTSEGSLSANGRYVAYWGYKSSSDSGIWLEDTCAGAPAGCVVRAQRVSVNGGTNLDPSNNSFAVSATGRYVAFWSTGRLYLRDTCIGAATGCVPSTTQIDITSSGTTIHGYGESVSLSGDGRLVAFAKGLGSPGGTANIYLRDTCAAVTNCVPSTVLLSVGPGHTPANTWSSRAGISGDGKYVVFDSTATNLVPEGTGGLSNVFRVNTGK